MADKFCSVYYIPIKSNNCASQMAQWAKALAVKSSDLSSIPRTHTAEGKDYTIKGCALTSTYTLWYSVQQELLG